jgi:ribosomal protein L7Ae-like RNA K-turn-binding protein
MITFLYFSIASNLFRLMSRYRPESSTEKKERLVAAAASEAKDQDVKQGAKPKHIKYGLNHITDLVESKKAKLVVIAHDVDPIELVVWLPALCRKMDVPYCIVKGKARLGQMVYKKTAAVLAITEVNKEDQSKLDQLVQNYRSMVCVCMLVHVVECVVCCACLLFLSFARSRELCYVSACCFDSSISCCVHGPHCCCCFVQYDGSDKKRWGGGIMGIKAQHVIRDREKARQKELAKASLVR